MRVLEGLYRKNCRLTRVYGFPIWQKVSIFFFLYTEENPMGLVWGSPIIPLSFMGQYLNNFLLTLFFFIYMRVL